MKPTVNQLRKRALDALLEVMADPEYATHQHHSDPDYTTQNGRMYGKGTEFEEGALDVPKLTLAADEYEMTAADHEVPASFRKLPPPVEKEEEEHEFFKESLEYKDLKSIRDGTESEVDFSEYMAQKIPVSGEHRPIRRVPFLGKYKLSKLPWENGTGGDYVVFDKTQPIARLTPGYFGVLPRYRNQGIGTELVRIYTRDFPDYKPHGFSPAGRRSFEKALSASSKTCECGHAMELHIHPPDFGCPHEKDGCGCKGATEKKTAAANVTQTPAFKTWFGQSQVVDARGNPLVMYHATQNDINVFLPYTHFGTQGAANDRDQNLRDFYDNTLKNPSRSSGANVIPVYLKVENPLRMQDLASLDSWGNSLDEPADDDFAAEGDERYPMGWEGDEAVATVLLNMGVIKIDEFEAHRDNNKAFQLLEQKGYDGIVYKNTVEDAGQDSWIVFSPNQIKSAISNAGTFGPEHSITSAAEEPDDEEHEAHVRNEAGEWAQYAEEGDAFDPAGDYLCGTCDMRMGTNQCQRVEGEISFTTGSCRLYHIGEPENEPQMEHPFSKEDAKYTERPHDKGYGCHRCEYGGEAKKPDADGRKSFCSFWGMHVIPNACCAENEGKDDVTFGKPSSVDVPLTALKQATYLSFSRKPLPTISPREAQKYEEYPGSHYASAQTLYHVTHTNHIAKIKKQGIIPLQTSNWVKGPDGKRYGEGEIFAMDNPNDAVRWGAKMLWEFYKSAEPDKISIVVFRPGNEKWQEDSADFINQAMNKGHWLKAIGKVLPNQIEKIVPLTRDMIRSVVQNNPVKLAADDIGWWKIARPTPQKIDLLQKQFKLTPEQIELCIQADPTEKENVAWIAKWLAKGNIALPEDGEKIKQQLELFGKLKKSPNFTGEKDIQKYQPAKLFETVEQNSGAMSKKQKDRDAVVQGAEVIVQEGDLTIYRVNDVKALNLLSSGTNWCTAHERHATTYLKQGPSYVFFKGGSAFAQFHPPSDQLMDRQDECMINHENLETVQVRVMENPTLRHAMSLLVAKAPDVKAWLELNVTDEGVVNAFRAGQQLTPEQEAELPSKTGLHMLAAYTDKFYPGQRWVVAETAFLAPDVGAVLELAEYAAHHIKGRWPEAEAVMLNPQNLQDSGGHAAKTVMTYVRNVTGRWPELEAVLHTVAPSGCTAKIACWYAIDILKQRWINVPGIELQPDGTSHEEKLIRSDAKMFTLYSKTFMPDELWTKFNEVIAPQIGGMTEDSYDAKHDVFIVEEWSDLRHCIDNIGNNGARYAIDLAFKQSSSSYFDGDGNYYGSVDMPDAEDLVKTTVPKLNYRAMLNIGKSLQSENPDAVKAWERRNQITNLDFSDLEQLSSLLMYFDYANPECSVWRNLRSAYAQGKEAQQKNHDIGNLEYELTSSMYERSADDGTIYTQLFYGPDFETSFNGNWSISPIYQVITREDAERLMEDTNFGEEPVKLGDLQIYVDEYSESDEDYEESFGLMNRWYTGGLPRTKDRNQMELPFTSSLLKKKRSFIDFHETPKALPPRDDMRRHIDEQAQDQVMDGVMDGIHPSSPQPSAVRRPQQQQIDPNLNPNGVSDYDPTLTTPSLRMQAAFKTAGFPNPQAFVRWVIQAMRAANPPIRTIATTANQIVQNGLNVMHANPGEPITAFIVYLAGLAGRQVLPPAKDILKEAYQAIRGYMPSRAASSTKTAKISLNQFKTWARSIPDFLDNISLEVEPGDKNTPMRTMIDEAELPQERPGSWTLKHKQNPLVTLQRVPGAIELTYKGKPWGYLGFPVDLLEPIIGPIRNFLENQHGNDDMTWNHIMHQSSKQADEENKETKSDPRDAAYKAFLQDPFMKQEALETGVQMSELWEQIGEHYMMGFSQEDHRREQEYEKPQAWHGTQE